MNYVIAVQAPAYALADDSFATESAFAVHLKELRASLGARIDKLVLVAPQFTEAEYQVRKPGLGIVSTAADGIEFVPAHRTSASSVDFWLSDAPRVWRQLSRVLPKTAMVHSGLADDIGRPLMAIVNFAAWCRRRPVLFVVDIDFRKDTQRFYQIGSWRLKRYVANRFFYDPLKWLQVWLAPRMFQLVLLKSAAMVKDFGRGKSHVKNFYDTVHSPNDILSVDEQRQHLARLAQPGGPLEIVFFGRFVGYKGLTYAIEAVRLAREKGTDVRLTFIGDGECREDLMRQTRDAGLTDVVTFHPPTAYGAPLFGLLSHAHLTIATPLAEDTPRAAFDSMARGLPIIAFDINYFRDLARESGAVALAAWPDPRSLADELIRLHGDRNRIARMAQSGLEFAAANTQEIWLARRASWVRAVIEK